MPKWRQRVNRSVMTSRKAMTLVVVRSQDGMVLVIAAVSLGDVVTPIGQQGWIVGDGGFLDHFWEIVKEADEVHFIGFRTSDAA